MRGLDEIGLEERGECPKRLDVSCLRSWREGNVTVSHVASPAIRDGCGGVRGDGMGQGRELIGIGGVAGGESASVGVLCSHSTSSTVWVVNWSKHLFSVHSSGEAFSGIERDIPKNL